jgi:DNA mismatch repair protein MutS
MLETANILKDADQSSFIILDEIGRGTSTFDGLSIAWATLENLISVNRSRTLFATHYHELTEIEKTSSYLSNMSCEIKEWNEEIIYSYKISKGVSHGSLGIKVAELAGFPKNVLRNAREILINLEKKRGFVKDQIYVEEEKIDKLREKLGSIDPDTITPKEALNWIYKLIENL